VVYLGIEAPAFPTGFPLHHQVVIREPLGEGNSLFLSLSPSWDSSRAPAGHRAVTISTHTALPLWWQLHQADPAAYAALKVEYAGRLLAAAETALPGLRSMARLGGRLSPNESFSHPRPLFRTRFMDGRRQYIPRAVSSGGCIGRPESRWYDFKRSPGKR
jgi:hypothetical protein